ELFTHLDLAPVPATERQAARERAAERVRALSPEAFRAAAPKWLAPQLYGRWDAEGFRKTWAAG
ncbi:dethiobiotin synthase, partial [Streptomyces albidoflavus]